MTKLVFIPDEPRRLDVPFAQQSRLAVTAACLALLVLCVERAEAQQTDAGSIESARQALDGSTDYPWYDSEHDSIRRVDVVPPKDVSARKSKWETKPSSWSWPSWLTELLQIIGWALLALAIFALIYFLVKAVATVDGLRGGGAVVPDDPLHGDIDRIEALPFQLQRPQTDLLGEARRYYEAGEYGQAIIYLYSYQLVQLDRHQFIRLTKGKTNRQYLREIRSRRDLFDVLHKSMVAFEDVFFGHHRLDRERFETCWRRLDEFHQQLEQAAA